MLSNRVGRAAFWLIVFLLAGSLPFPQLALAHSASAVRYRIERSVRLGEPNAWDYVVYDAKARRAFVAHGNELTVVDGRSGRIVGNVGPIPGGPHGIAFDTPAGIGITDDGRKGEAVLFSLETLRVTGRLAIQPGADAVIFDPVSKHAFIVDGDTGDVAVVDPIHARVVTLIHLGGDLEYAVAGGNGKVYVNGVTDNEIFRINTETNRVDAVWPMVGCHDPHGLAMDRRTHRLFSGCENRRLMILNSKSGAVVGSVPIGGGSDAVAFDSRRQRILVPGGTRGTVSVISEVNPRTFIPAEVVATAPSGRTMAVDPESGRLFVAAGGVKSRAAWEAFSAAYLSGKKPGRSPLIPDSLHLLLLDPVD